MNTPRPAATRDLEQAEQRILEAMRFCATGTTQPQKPGYVKDLTRDIHRGRLTSVRQILAYLHDKKVRGASKAHLYAVADAIRDEIDRMYADDEAVVDFIAAHLAEERAEAEQDVAEAEFMANPSGWNAQRVAHATRQHIIASTLQLRSVFHRATA